MRLNLSNRDLKIEADDDRIVSHDAPRFMLYWALSIYEKNLEISVVAKVEFPIGKKLFHLVVNPGTWLGARPWTWNWYKLQET